MKFSFARARVAFKICNFSQHIGPVLDRLICNFRVPCKDGRMLELSATVNVAPGFLSGYTKIVRFCPVRNCNCTAAAAAVTFDFIFVVEKVLSTTRLFFLHIYFTVYLANKIIVLFCLLLFLLLLSLSLLLSLCHGLLYIEVCGLQSFRKTYSTLAG